MAPFLQPEEAHWMKTSHRSLIERRCPPRAVLDHAKRENKLLGQLPEPVAERMKSDHDQVFPMLRAKLVLERPTCCDA